MYITFEQFVNKERTLYKFGIIIIIVYPIAKKLKTILGITFGRMFLLFELFSPEHVSRCLCYVLLVIPIFKSISRLMTRFYKHVFHLTI